MNQNTLGAGDPCALVSHIFRTLSGALRTVCYLLATTQVKELQSWYGPMVHYLSGLHVLTLATGDLVLTKTFTSVRRRSILYRTRAASRGKGGARVVATACLNRGLAAVACSSVLQAIPTLLQQTSPQLNHQRTPDTLLQSDLGFSICVFSRSTSGGDTRCCLSFMQQQLHSLCRRWIF